MKSEQENELAEMTADMERVAAGRVFGPAHLDADRVGVSFDWEVPACTNDPLIFHLNITRGARSSSVRFAIALQKLEEGELTKLHNFLVHQHSGVRDDYIFGRGLTMLLTLSLRQQGVAADQIDAEVRNLLLVSIL